MNRLKKSRTLFEILGTFLKLGSSSFGGPVAHLGYFRNEFVARRKWLSENALFRKVSVVFVLFGCAAVSYFF